VQTHNLNQKKLRRNEVNNNHSKKWGGKAAWFIIPGLLAAFAAAALVPLPTAGHNNFLVRFGSAIGVDPISNVVVNGTTVTASPNVVRGISPAGQIWRIDDLDANITTDGRIRARGRGLLLGGGNGIGTNGGQSVFATLFCGPAASASASSSTETGVALDSDGDFVIEDILSPMPPSSCETPVLLIRTAAGAHPWFAAGIEK
jgi:hypothetical protein